MNIKFSNKVVKFLNVLDELRSFVKCSKNLISVWWWSWSVFGPFTFIAFQLFCQKRKEGKKFKPAILITC